MKKVVNINIDYWSALFWIYKFHPTPQNNRRSCKLRFQKVVHYYSI